MTQFRPEPIAYLTGTLSDDLLPPGVSDAREGRKFLPDGTLHLWPGNTMICHIDPDSDAHAALVDIQTELAAGPHAGAFTFLPPSSLHMTVFQGISGPSAHLFDWPEGVDTATPRDEVSRILLDRLEAVDLPDSRRIRALNVFAGHSMTVDGVGPDETGLRETRTRLRKATGLTSRGFDTYTFHITLAYLLRWLTEDEARDVCALSDDVFARQGDRLQDIRLGRVEFCNFEHMHHFEPLRLL
ncbi:DUF1868 domain-containing protein [Psychromarinibacter sp. S121]|uniref:DUF1868 domain-containing protein n=1 Tax=Psychromarinibacter sp. S121 TaxID=3415127 RepID=UPI003C7B9027